MCERGSSMEWPACTPIDTALARREFISSSVAGVLWWIRFDSLAPFLFQRLWLFADVEWLAKLSREKNECPGYFLSHPHLEFNSLVHPMGSCHSIPELAV
jgi:hypothetical protein